MNSLQSIEPGFAHETDDSQLCFRAAMKALSRPGLAVPLPSNLRIIEGASPTAAALLLALVDQDTSVYLSESRAGSSLRSWLKFHTDCRLTVDRRRADFAWIGSAKELSRIDGFRGGDDYEPQSSTTIVIETSSLDTRGGWRLTGPGINGAAALSVPGLGQDFVSQWATQRDRFPEGVDLLFVADDVVVGLPRTTRIEY